MLPPPVITHVCDEGRGETPPRKCPLSSSGTDQAGPKPWESPSVGVFPKGAPRSGSRGAAGRLLLVPGPVAPSSGCWQSAATSLSPPRVPSPASLMHREGLQVTAATCNRARSTERGKGGKEPHVCTLSPLLQINRDFFFLISYKN